MITLTPENSRKPEDYESNGVLLKLKNVGDAVEGNYLGHKYWLGKDMKTGEPQLAKGHVFAEAEVCRGPSASPKDMNNDLNDVPDGEIAVIHGTAGITRFLAKVPQGSRVSIRYDGKTVDSTKDGKNFIKNNYTFGGPDRDFAPLFRADWRELANQVTEKLYCGKVSEEEESKIFNSLVSGRGAQAHNGSAAPSGPVPVPNAATEYVPSSSMLDACADDMARQFSPAGTAPAYVVPAYPAPVPQPFMTPAEQKAQIVFLGRKRWNMTSGTDESVIIKVMTETGLGVIEPNYEAIIGKLKV